MTQSDEPSAPTRVRPRWWDEPEVIQAVDDGDELIHQFRTKLPPRVFIISGPSGVGKDAVLDEVRKVLPDAHWVVTATSRKMRLGEYEGHPYNFLTPEDFEQKIADGYFVEYSVNYGSGHYGVPRNQIEPALERGQDVVIKIDYKGAATLRERLSDSVSIFLVPESMEALRSRLDARGTENEQKQKSRFLAAVEELEAARGFDYVVFNHSNGLPSAVADVIAIIDHESRRPQRNATKVLPIRER